MEINVGEYVRTRDGIIKRVSSYNPQENNPLWETLNGNVQMKGNITKHSKDIIDLVEKSDVILTKDNNKYALNYEFEIEYDSLYSDWAITIDDYITIYSKDIKSILTKEQFESNAYKIEKEV